MGERGQKIHYDTDGAEGSIIQSTLDYRDVDPVELKAGGKHIMVTAITVLIR